MREDGAHISEEQEQEAHDYVVKAAGCFQKAFGRGDAHIIQRLHNRLRKSLQRKAKPALMSKMLITEENEKQGTILSQFRQKLEGKFLLEKEMPKKVDTLSHLRNTES